MMRHTDRGVSQREKERKRLPLRARRHVPDEAGRSYTGMGSCRRTFPLEPLALHRPLRVTELNLDKHMC